MKENQKTHINQTHTHDKLEVSRYMLKQALGVSSSGAGEKIWGFVSQRRGPLSPEGAQQLLKALGLICQVVLAQLDPKEACLTKTPPSHFTETVTFRKLCALSFF